MVDFGAQLPHHLGLLVDRASQPRRPGGERSNRTVQGAMDHLGTADLISSDPGEPAADRRNGRGWQQALIIDDGLRHSEQRRRAQTSLAHHLAEMRRHLGHSTRGHPVEHDSDGGAALGG